MSPSWHAFLRRVARPHAGISLHASQSLRALQEINMLTLLITAPILVLIAVAEILR
jgi:hypothetical protein